jgi:hypothetical protein
MRKDSWNNCAVLNESVSLSRQAKLVAGPLEVYWLGKPSLLDRRTDGGKHAFKNYG